MSNFTSQHCETSRRFVDSCITQARVGDTWHTSSAIHCSAVPSPCPPPPHYGDADTFNHPGQIISRKMLQRWENSTFKTQQPNRIEDGQNISFLFNFEALTWKSNCMLVHPMMKMMIPWHGGKKWVNCKRLQLTEYSECDMSQPSDVCRALTTTDNPNTGAEKCVNILELKTKAIRRFAKVLIAARPLW